MCGLKQTSKQSVIAVSAPPNKSRHSSRKRRSSEQHIQVSKSSATLDLALISSERALEPYWSDLCQELQSVLWCPPAIGSLDRDCRLSAGQSNCTGAPLSRWRKVIAQRDSTHPNLSDSLQVSSPAITGSEAKIVVVARKVRVFPERESQWRDLCGLHRTAYNMAVVAINAGKPDQAKLKQQIREELRLRWAGFEDATFVSTVCDEAVNLAFDTLRRCIRKWKTGDRAKIRFKSRKDARQGFTVQRCADGGQIFPRALGTTHITEELGDVKGQTVRVTLERGRYFVSFKQQLTLLSESQAGNKVAAVDPGVRTFATVFGADDCIKYGDGFKDELQKLSDKHDYWRSVRDKLPNLHAQWVKDRLRQCQKKMNKIANRMHDLVDDLHWRVGIDLIRNHDVILLPTFETSQMSKKSKNRKIRRGTVRAMLSMSFFKFGQRLEWLCRKYGKTLVRVNEAYTSKTDSRTGEIKQVGGAKTINGLDRDANGARGIFLRALTRVA